MDLEKIADRIAIEDLLVRYTHAIDTKNFESLDNVFTEDADLDYTEVGGIKGKISEMKEWFGKSLSIFKVTQHLIGKSLIEMSDDGNTAECRTIVHNSLTVSVNDEGKYDKEGEKTATIFCGCWYLDTCVKTDDGWRIAKKYEELGYFEGDLAV